VKVFCCRQTRTTGVCAFEAGRKLLSMIVSCHPVPALRHLIRYYYQVHDYLAERAALQPVPARSPQILEFMFGTPYQVRRLDRQTAVDARPVTLVGAQTFRRVELTLHGRVDAFTIAFQPGGVSALFAVPAVELTNDDFEGAAVLGQGVVELHHRLGEVSSFADRVRVADEYLCAKRPVLDSVSGIVRTARGVLASSGCVRVADLACNAGLGIRQFERRFSHEIGIAPKMYVRIVRFEAALRYKATVPAMRWTDIAHSLGYHDQMHMVHDFNRLSGDSPTGICGRLDMFVRPEVVSADLALN
jgi:AraC-like DNA-binding protein